MGLDIKTLNSFLGYGDFPNAEMLVLSKHEGANHDFIAEELDARIHYFGTKQEYWLDGKDRNNGYWHPSTQEGGEMINDLAKGNRVRWTKDTFCRFLSCSYVISLK